MIRSMTGYGRAVETLNNREITVEVRSVNNRYLDCSVKLPHAFSYMEDAVKKLVKESISRGKTDVFISVRTTEGSDTKVTLNKSVVESYLAAMNAMTYEYGIRNDISVSALAALPDIFTVNREELDEEQASKDILQVVAEALALHTAMREKEGAAMEADLRNRADVILGLVGKVEERSPVTLKEYRNRLRERMLEVLSDTSIDESRIVAEAAIYADKIAVDEETVRLRSHFAQYSQMLTAGGPIGRKLDFLLQEMNRETNTIGSKGNDLQQAQTVVAIKAELEKIREQVQNIE